MDSVLKQERVIELFDYREDGELVWRYREDVRNKGWNTRWAGTVAGSIFYTDNAQYWRIDIDRKHYMAHRLIWLYHYGDMPEFIDHKDGNDLNNRIWNLRETNRTGNLANSYKLERGVYPNGTGFKALIGFNNERIYLGTYHSKEEAQAVYDAAADRYFGEFARCNRLDRRD